MWGRNSFLTKLEAEIQRRTKSKDKGFILSGEWKKFIGNQDGFGIYAVDGEWVRNNLGVLFEHGGHGFVHEFIPTDEIWVETHHHDNCGCKNLKGPRQELSQQYFDSTVIHEITEFWGMKKGTTYEKAHKIAIKKEIEVGILEDPYGEI